jgi:hypothetical protein
MANNPYHYGTDQKGGDPVTNDKVAGEIRAFMAVLLELTEVTPEVIAAAKNRLRNEHLNSREQHTCDYATLKVRMKLPIDEHAEAALDELHYRARRRQRNETVDERPEE